MHVIRSALSLSLSLSLSFSLYPPTPPACQNASRQQHQPCTPTSRATLYRFLLFFKSFRLGGVWGGNGLRPLNTQIGGRRPEEAGRQRKTTEDNGGGCPTPLPHLRAICDTLGPCGPNPGPNTCPEAQSMRYLRHLAPLGPQPWP